MLPRFSQAGFSKCAVLILLMLFWGALPLVAKDAMEAPGNPKAGRDLFVNKGCIRCHSIWESGQKRGPNLASVGMGRNLYDICASVWSHWSRMNAVLEREHETRATLTAQDFRDIIAYLYYLNYNTEPGNADNGEKIFSAKGCIQCHALEPLQAKDMPGRAIYEMQQFSGPVTLAVAVWNHGTNMFERMKQKNMHWPEFQGKEVADLVAFIRSRNRPVPDSAMTVPGEPARGQILFNTKACGGCHKPEAQGSRQGPNMASTGIATSMSSLIANLWNHYPRMSQSINSSGVGYPKVSREEMEDLLSYVYWLKAYGASGNAETGRNLYQSKNCAACHSAAPGKESSAPDLAKSETTGSPYALLAAIWNHGPKMESLLRAKKISWPALGGDEMRDLVAYFRSREK
jgi:mono/diheme cytochrome c family protein